MSCKFTSMTQQGLRPLFFIQENEIIIKVYKQGILSLNILTLIIDSLAPI